MYNITLTTNWTPELYPKQFPTWRPPAQWSQMWGYSHARPHILYEIGSVASDGVASFVETGSSDSLLSELDLSSVLDIVTSPAITSGAGSTRTTVFVDGTNSKVSLMSKLVPSPDWFVGVDSLDLCESGQLAASVVRDLAPQDGGTDNGFTFTSPNWPTQPRGVTFSISSRYPTHPAGSFHYPHLDSLPVIATIRFEKIKEYRETKPRGGRAMAGDEYKYFHDNIDNKTGPLDLDFVPLKEKSKKDKKKPKTNLAAFRNKPADVNSLTNFDSLLSSNLLSEKSFGMKQARRRKRKLRNKRRHNKKKKTEKTASGCHVTEWSEWSSCSKSCGIGERVRRRKLSSSSKSASSMMCPPLKQMSWCGSARDCHPGYFDW